jgi:septum formation protein
MSDPLILASQSAARQMLLRNVGISFAAVPADIDERALQAAMGEVSAHDLALSLATAKAMQVAASRRGAFVIGADQTLSLGQRLFNKPRDRGAAAAQLGALQGQTHQLNSAVVLVRDDAVLFADVGVARMTMRALRDDEIAAYLDAAGDAVLGSVGAYQLEGLGARLFSAIDGDHFTILGLPLLPLLAALRRERVVAF